MIRIGKVTGIYPDEGKVQVYYEDINTTAEKLPLMTFNKEYEMPEVGDIVLSVHMDNDASTGFVLGTYYNETVKPPTDGTKYLKEMLKDKAKVECKNDTLKITAPKIEFVAGNSKVELEENIIRITSPTVKIITDNGTTTY